MQKQLIDLLDDQIQKFPIDLLFLFGSTIEGFETPRSDIDVAILYQKDSDSKTRFRSSISISTIIENETNKQVDVISLNDASIIMKYQVVTKGILLFCFDEERRIDFQCQTIMSYEDYLPYLKLYQQSTLDSFGSV